MVQCSVRLGAILAPTFSLLPPLRGARKGRLGGWQVLGLLGSKPHVPVANT